MKCKQCKNSSYMEEIPLDWDGLLYCRECGHGIEFDKFIKLTPKNQEYLLEQEYPERLGRLCMSAEWLLDNEKREGKKQPNITGIARFQLYEQVYRTKMWAELRDKQRKKNERKTSHRS